MTATANVLSLLGILVLAVGIGASARSTTRIPVVICIAGGVLLFVAAGFQIAAAVGA